MFNDQKQAIKVEVWVVWSTNKDATSAGCRTIRRLPTAGEARIVGGWLNFLDLDLLTRWRRRRRAFGGRCPFPRKLHTNNVSVHNHDQHQHHGYDPYRNSLRLEHNIIVQINLPDMP